MIIGEFLVEGIVHPEDLVISGGSAGARRAVEALLEAPKDPKSITIKWDGFPALIFGRNHEDKLVIADKHMFDKSDGSGRVTSPQEFRQYDVNRGANRGDLYPKIDTLWPLLEKIIPSGTKGYYWGDLLYVGRLRPQNGFYVFKPNTVTYKVVVNSEIGQRIAASLAGIAVHSYFADIGQPDQPLNGLGGLPDLGPVLFVSGTMTQSPNIKLDPKVANAATAAIAKYGQLADKFNTDLAATKSKVVQGLMERYINFKVTQGNFNNLVEDFYGFLQHKLNPTSHARLLGDKQNGWLYTNGKAGMVAVFSIWIAVYNLKMSIKHQIDSQVASGDVQAYTGNAAGHEGYVAGAGADKIKLIDRLNFSKANFAKNT